MAYASDLLAFPFRSVALHSLRSSNLARHQSTMMTMKIYDEDYDNGEDYDYDNDNDVVYCRC